MMEGPCTLLPQHCVTLSGLHSLYKEHVLCDVTLQAHKQDTHSLQTVTVDAHKCVLAAGSPYFRYTINLTRID